MSKDKVPTLYFDPRGGYWRQYEGGRYVRLSDSDASLHLREAGLYGGKVEEGLNAVEKAKFVAQRERFIDYAGPLAGYRCGYYTLPNGNRLLITSERKTWKEDKRSKPDFILDFQRALLGDTQALYAALWHKFAIESLERQDFRPAQFVVLAGPATCGKSFWQVITTELLGGREESPAKFLWGEDNFNAQLAGAEHWRMDEATGSTDMRSRRKFGEFVKLYTVGESLAVRAMQRAAITLPCFRRITQSLNWSTENLNTLPLIDDSMRGKLMLFKCDSALDVLSTDRETNMANLRAAMPGYIRFLKSLKVEKRYSAPREGVAHYHDPALSEAIYAVSHQRRLLDIIDEVCFATSRDTKRVSADDLERELRNSGLRGSVEKLLAHSVNACGNFLGRLREEEPNRVSSTKVKGKTMWEITPPPLVPE